jgi:hypothetical protein
MIIWSNILVPVASMLITVFATLYTVSERVKNENREKHKPYLTLNDIEKKEIDEYKYYLTIYGQKYAETKEKNTTKEEKENEENQHISVTLLLDNIGYGVASNIKFYNLLTGEEIHGSQTPSKEKNQKLFTTFDIATNQQKKIQTKIYKNINEKQEYDNCKILCIYKDLNNNIYDLIISINVKTNNLYDFSTYQRTSHTYNNCIKENKNQYKKIIKQYKK